MVISIIIPVLQEEKLLERTLAAFIPIFRERYDIEIIVSDGGSTDRTVEIARKYADKVVLCEDKHRQTIAEGRNAGAEVATGDVLVFINGDTVPANTEEFLAHIAAWAREISADSPIALACPVHISPEERRVSDVLFHGFYNAYVGFLNRIGTGMGRGECQIVRADIFRKVNGYKADIAAGEDFDLFKRLAHEGKIGYSRKTLVYESPRRFRKFGYLRILLSWTLNALSVLWRGKSLDKVWEAVR